MELHRLVVRIGADLSEMQSKLNTAQDRIVRMGGKMQAAGRKLSLGVTLPLVGIGVASTKMASDAEEAANKFDVVMGPAAARLRREFETLHKTIPLARHEMESLSAGIQDLLVPMGVARDEAASMSLEMVKLAGDLGSFNDVAPTQVLEAMKSALAGSSEPMRRFGVDTRVAALEAIALSHGLIQAGEEMDSTATAQAVLLAIQKDSVDAMGDAARTADSAANSFKFFARDAKELGVTIGQILLPIVTPMVQKMTAALNVFNNLSPSAQKVVVSLGALVAALGPVLYIFGTLVTLLPAIKVGLIALTGPIGLAVVALGAMTAAGIALINNWQIISYEVSAMVDKIRDALVGRFGAIVDSVREKIDAVKGFFKNMADAVVLRSYVPDMIDGIAREFGRLADVMVRPAMSAAADLEDVFRNIKIPGLGGDGILGQIGGSLKNQLIGMIGPQAVLTKLTSTLAPMMMEAASTLVSNLFGGHGDRFAARQEVERALHAANAITLRGSPYAAMSGITGPGNVPGSFNAASARREAALTVNGGIHVAVDSATTWEGFKRKAATAASGGDPLARAILAGG